MSANETADAPEPAWPRIVKLRHPVDIGLKSGPIAELEFGRGKLGFLRGMKTNAVPGIDELILLSSKMCGQPLKVIESLDPEDCEEVLAISMLFFARCLGASKTP